jgi:hypothetical protein
MSKYWSMHIHEFYTEICERISYWNHGDSGGGLPIRHPHPTSNGSFSAAMVNRLAVLFFLAAAVAPAHAAAPLMSIPGHADVDYLGHFTYAIPIQVPPGTKRMAPQLSLNYSSGAGDGHEGLGWSIGGMSVITRCPQTIVQDGAVAGVNYDQNATGNDRYCLDGQRLILTSGSYGANGSQYQTEISSFSKIVANTVTGITGVAYFDVWKKDGTHYQYGNTTNSNGNSSNARILVAGGCACIVRLWALNQITDTKGNYIAYTYGQNSTTGEYYPTRIDYTGNAGTSPVTATYNYVEFFYSTPRTNDTSIVYHAGAQIEVSKLLSDIKTFTGTSLTFDYKIGYNQATSGASHDELANVTLYDHTTNTLAETTFGWQGSRDTLTMTPTTESWAGSSGVLPGDFNGDGLTDIMLATTSCPSGGVIYSGSQSGTFASAGMNATYDYYLYDSTTLEHYNSTACFQTPLSEIGDIDGDGISDVATMIYTYSYVLGYWLALPSGEVLQNSGTGQLTQVSPDGSLGWPFVLTGFNNFPSDYNGDGLSDGFVYPGTGSTGYAYLSEQGHPGFFSQDGGHPGFGTGVTWMAGDFDGDGCTDLLLQGSTNAIDYFCQPRSFSKFSPELDRRSGGFRRF